MKLKRLMPLGVIVGLTTTVTPLVTSCGTKNWNEAHTWDNTKEKPVLEPKETGINFIDWSECMESYLKDVSNNHTILANDIMYSNWYQDGIDDNPDNDDPAPVTPKDITSMSITLNNIDVDSHKLSFINEFTWKPVAENEDNKTTEKYVVSNMKYVILKRIDQRYGDYNKMINIIAPKVWMDTLYLLQESWRGEDVRKECERVVNNDIENLSQDRSWYVEVPATAPINGKLTMEKINYKNIKTIGAFGFWWKTLPLTIATTYYENAGLIDGK